MPTVSDADVIIHLINLKSLNLLNSLYGQIAIAEYVKNEILARNSMDIQEAFWTFIKVHKIPDSLAQRIARQHGIHLGEAHTKALGELLKSELFLSNEKKVRKAAKEENFRVTGTIGIILKAVRQRIISKPKAHELLSKMKEPLFRVHPDIIDKAIFELKNL